jgi:hypothetical protein
MTTKRLLTCAALAFAAAVSAPSAAQAVDPPDGDNYLAPVFLNDTSSRIPYNNPIGYTADTTTYTTQGDLFNPPGSGGPPEPTICGRSQYGNTIWTVFYSHRWGVMRIDAAGPFDSVIGFVPFRSLSDPEPLLRFGTCNDSLFGFQQSDAEIVFPGQWWAVQVGGTGTPPGGQVQVKFELSPPPQVDGQAFLFWKTGPLRITSLTTKKVTRGATLTLSCSKRACKKRTVRVPKPVVNRLLAGGASGSAAPARGAQARYLARRIAFTHEAAKTGKLLSNKKVKPGTKIELRITAFGYIGKYYRWNVTRSGVSAAITRCMNPDSKKPRKRCSG